MKTVTITITRDVTTIGNGATSDDLETYTSNLKALIEREFGCEVHLVWTDGLTTSDDPDVHARIREIESGDEWHTLL
jgi:hypothetical protein